MSERSPSAAKERAEKVYDTMDDYDLAVERVNTLNMNASRQGATKRYGVIETRTWNEEVRTVDRYLILVKEDSRGR